MLTLEQLDAFLAFNKKQFKTALIDISNKACHDCLINYKNIKDKIDLEIYLFVKYNACFCLCKKHAEIVILDGHKITKLSEQDIFYLKIKC